MRKLLFFAAIVGVTASLPAAAQDGAALYQSKGCVACHGPDGNTTTVPAYPKIGGQNEQYLLAQMKDIKSGARNNGLSAVMKPIVMNVTDEELAAIAKWLSQQPAS